MNFTLRAWTHEDLKSLVKYANNYNISKNMTDQFPYPYGVENGRAFIEFATKDIPIHISAIEINGEALGGIGVHPQRDVQRKNAELGYWLVEAFLGKGVITRAIPQLVDLAFKIHPITRLYARSFGTHVASQKVLEKAVSSSKHALKKVCLKTENFWMNWFTQ